MKYTASEYVPDKSAIEIGIHKADDRHSNRYASATALASSLSAQYHTEMAEATDSALKASIVMWNDRLFRPIVRCKLGHFGLVSFWPDLPRHRLHFGTVPRVSGRQT
jgi:hypothetical protein